VGDGRGAVAGLCQAVAAGISRRGGGKGGLVPDRRAGAGVEELHAAGVDGEGAALAGPDRGRGRRTRAD
jgi:hypothetical protein